MKQSGGSLTPDYNKPFNAAERLDGFHTAIMGRVEFSNFQETLQDAIAGVLAGLTDELQADLYARIVDGYTLVLNGQAVFKDLLRYELQRTNLWGAINA